MAKDFSSELVDLRPALYGFSRHFTFDREEAADLVQDTLLKALTYQDKYQRDTNLKGWLYTIMRNIFINNYRRAKRMVFTNDGAIEQKVLNVKEEYTFYKPGDATELKEVWRNINGLKDELSTPFKMHLTGYKYHEIARTLKIPLGTVKNRIFHARQLIKHQIDC
jgi:RNA polymerase sigma factor (sigma-70 family)